MGGFAPHLCCINFLREFCVLFPLFEDNKMSQVDDLTAGDSTPKLTKASIKDVALALNRISYAFKTPDASVAPDGLQLSSDGNLSLGGIPLAYSAVGRSMLVQDVNNAMMGVYSSSSNAIISARTSLTTGYAALELRKTDDSVFARLRYSPTQGVAKLELNNAGTVSPTMRFDPSGVVTLGDSSILSAKLQILGGVVSGGSESMILLTPTTATNPTLIGGVNGGQVQLAGGINTATGGRGAQIDLNSVGWSTLPSAIVFRTGTNTDGTSPPEVGRISVNGRLAIGPVGGFDPESLIHARAPNGTRGRIMVDGMNDFAGFTARRSNGSWTAVTAVKNNDTLLFLNSHGAVSSASYGATGLLSCVATEDWTPTATGHAWRIDTMANGTYASALTSMYWSHQGYVGINNTSPKVRFVVSKTDGGDGFEVDPSAGGNFIQSYNRSTDLYSALGYKAQSHTWTRSTDGVSVGMTLGSNGTFAVNTNVTSGGSGNTLVDSKVIVGGSSGNITYLMLQGGTDYAGLKIKSGAMHVSSGGVNNYDITVRPGDTGTGVAQSPDKVLIRLEASSSMRPRVILQPDGGTQQVIVGDPTNASSNAKFVIVNEGAFNYPALTIFGKDMSDAGASPSADLVIQRDGAVSGVQGMMPWIQLESKSAAFAGNNAVAIGGAANNFQVWNFVSNNWVQHFTVGPAGLQSNVSALIKGGLTVRGASAATGNIVLQSNDALGVAHWISSKTSGFMHIGGNGSAEPAVGAMVVASSGRSIGLWPTNETQSTYTYSHGGTVGSLHITNPDTSVNAQAHLFLASGQVNNVGSALGTISWVMPNLASNGTARVANIGGTTDSNHTAAQATGRIEFATKNNGDSTATTRVRIRASGNVTFGTTMNDSARLYIYNEGRNVDGVRVDFTDTSATTSSFVSHRSDSVGYAMSFLVAGNFAGSITHPSATTTNYGTGSDRRIKKNIVDAPSGGNIIDALRVVSHDFTADDYHVPYGFVAQELYESYPPAVVTGDDAPDLTPQGRVWQVDNSKLVPLLVKEVQDLRQEKVDMKAKMADMETNLAELRELVNLLLQDKNK